MSDSGEFVFVTEEGPREGFQIEPGPISTAAKIELIDALSQTGAQTIQIASFVNPKAVPGWADADAVVAGFAPRPGTIYRATWLNTKGMERARTFRDRLSLSGMIALSASEAFSIRNLKRDRQGQIDTMMTTVAEHIAADVPIERLVIMAAFGCNFSGVVPVTKVVETIRDGMEIARYNAVTVREVTLADSMGWCTPHRVVELLDAMNQHWPDIPVALHLHDTRGMGIASAYAGLTHGVRRFDAAVGGLGGCPFAGQSGAPGNIATEELVLLCDELGFETGIDLDAVIRAGRLAEEIVGHQLPSSLLRSGRMRRFGEAQA